jgi:hypothetical protein
MCAVEDGSLATTGGRADRLGTADLIGTHGCIARVREVEWTVRLRCLTQGDLFR